MEWAPYNECMNFDNWGAVVRSVQSVGNADDDDDDDINVPS